MSQRRSGPPLPGTGCCCCPRLRAPARAPAHAHPVWPERSRRPGPPRWARGLSEVGVGGGGERSLQTIRRSECRSAPKLWPLLPGAGDRGPRWGSAGAPWPRALELLPSRRPQQLPARRPRTRRLAKRQRVAKRGKKKAKPIGDRPRLRPPPRPAAALHQKALRPGQPPPSAPAWGWTPASSLTSCRPPCLPSPPQGGWEALRLSPVLQGRRGYGKFGDPGKGGPHPGLGAGDASSTFTTGPWRRALSKRHGICVL